MYFVLCVVELSRNLPVMLWFHNFAIIPTAHIHISVMIRQKGETCLSKDGRCVSDAKLIS